MKNTILAILLISGAFAFDACGGSSAAKNSNEKTPAEKSVANGDSTYSGQNSFTYTINNRKVAIKDVMQNGDGKNWMALYLNQVTVDNATGMLKLNVTNQLTKEVFNFTVPATTGKTVILHYSPSLSGFANKKNNEALYMSPKYINYYADNVTIAITSISATNVTGTFEGLFTSGDKAADQAAITSGSFDLQFTKEKEN